jgi:hypothetical protein
VLISPIGGIYEVAFEIASCGTMYIPRFMKIDAYIQAILRLCPSNLRGCNVGTTDGRDL